MNMRLIAQTDLGGRADADQVFVHRGHAYIGHVNSGGFSVVDVRDPRTPAPVAFLPAAPNTSHARLHLYDGLLLVANARDKSAGRRPRTERGPAAALSQGRAGLAVYDVSRPASPREMGFMPISGDGIRRVWYPGGRWAYASACIDGFTGSVFMTIDLDDPSRPREAGRFWLPGMNVAAGEIPMWSGSGQFGLQQPIVVGDTAYLAWQDAGLVVLDVSDRAAPSMIAHRSWSPPFGGGTRICLPLPGRELIVVLDEALLDNQQDGEKLIWLFDNRTPSAPVSISTLPTPADDDYAAMPGHFGPYELHTNAPGSFMSSDLVFATYQNAGVRVFDIKDKYAPRQVGAFVPTAPTRSVDPRLNRRPARRTGGIFVDSSGLVYATDPNTGLTILDLGPRK